MFRNHLFKLMVGVGVVTFTLLATQINNAGAGVTYYVRTDGGSPTQCTGLVDSPYPGSGTGQPCAWDHPFRALPPGGTPQITGGDTLVIASGQYKMGYGAPGAINCDAAGSFDCVMIPIPSGSDPAHPTRILGAGWDSGCSTPPQLWGSERPWFIVNLTDSNNVEINCFEITDHSSCIESYPGNPACERDTSPYGAWASYGLHAEDSANVILRNLNIHGLASGGVHAGRLTDWTVENVRIAGNGWVGWDGDLWDDAGDSNSGTLTFRHWTVEWNGCGETYPGGKPFGCWGQEAGGYGDGVGTGATGGNWIIEDSSFLHNTSDGLDLLYHTLGGSVTLNRVRAEGNAGNQIKITGPTQISNSVLVGNCAFFQGKPFTYWVDHCRALGNTVELAFTGGEQDSIINSTIYGQGDGLVGGGPHPDFSCNGTETVIARNSIFLGDTDYFDSTDISFLFYQEGCSNLKLDSNYNVIFNAKNVSCGVSGTYTNSGANDSCANPLLIGPLTGTNYGMLPGANSPAIDSGDEALCAADPVNNLDQLNQPRPIDGDGNGVANCDRGALEVQGAIKLLTFNSTGANDGWVLESTEISGKAGTLNNGSTTFNVGDDASNKQYRAILSFDTSSIPDTAVIVSVILQVKKSGVVGTNPFKTHGSLLADVRKPYFGSGVGLSLGDFNAAADKSAALIFSPTPIANWYSAIMDKSNFATINLTGTTQFRLRFTKDDNNDFGADYVKFYSGNYAATSDQPMLIIQYYAP